MNNVNQFVLFTRIVAARKWRNGRLREIAKKILSGQMIVRESDTDFDEDEWNNLESK